MRDRETLARRVLRIGNFLAVIVGDLPGDLPDCLLGERLLGERLLGERLLGERLLGDFLLGESCEYLEGLFVILLVLLPTLSYSRNIKILNIYVSL